MSNQTSLKVVAIGDVSDASRKLDELSSKINKTAADSKKSAFEGRAGNLAGNMVQNVAGGMGASGDIQNAIDLALDGNMKAAAAVAGTGAVLAVGQKAWEMYWHEVATAQQQVAMSATTLEDFQRRMAAAGDVKVAGLTANLQVYKDIGGMLTEVAGRFDIAGNASRSFGALAAVMSGNYVQAFQQIKGNFDATITALTQGTQAYNAAQSEQSQASFAVAQAMQQDAEAKRKNIEATAATSTSALQLAQSLATVTAGYGEWGSLTDTQRAKLVGLATEMRNAAQSAAAFAKNTADIAANARGDEFDASKLAAVEYGKELDALIAKTRALATPVTIAAPFEEVDEAGRMAANARMEDQLRADKALKDGAAMHQAAVDAEANAKQIAQTYKANAQQARSAIESMVAPLLEKSEVTSKDIEDTKAGKYKDKPDEDRRRLEAIKVAPSLDHELFAKLPKDIQAELKTAFDAGGAGGMQDAINGMLNKGGGMGDIRLTNVDMIADKIVAQLAEAAGKKDLMAAVMEKLKGKGIDPNSPQVQALLGIKPPDGATANMPQAAQMTAQNILGQKPEDGKGDKNPMTGAMKPMADGMTETLGTVKVDSAMMTAVTNAADGIKKVGNKAADIMGAAFVAQLQDSDYGFGKNLVKALTTIFDGRYMRVFTGLVE